MAPGPFQSPFGPPNGPLTRLGASLVAFLPPKVAPRAPQRDPKGSPRPTKVALWRQNGPWTLPMTLLATQLTVWHPKISPRATQMDPKADQIGSKSSICRHIDGPMDRCTEIPIYRPIDVADRRGTDSNNLCLGGIVSSLIRNSGGRRTRPPTPQWT